MAQKYPCSMLLLEHVRFSLIGACAILRLNTVFTKKMDRIMMYFLSNHSQVRSLLIFSFINLQPNEWLSPHIWSAMKKIE